MKKRICLLLSAVFISSLCGCGKSVVLPPLPTVTPEVTEVPQETADESIEEAAEIGDTVVIIKNFHTRYEVLDPENGERVILAVRNDTPKVNMEGRDEAAEKINEFIARVTETFETGDDYTGIKGTGICVGTMNMQTAAEDNYNYLRSIDAELDIPEMYEFEYSQSADVMRADSKVISLAFNDFSYMGGVHGSYGMRAYNFNAETGELISLADLSDDYDGLAACILNRMKEIVAADGEYHYGISNYIFDDDILEDSLKLLLRDGSWYLDDCGIVLFSDVYELGSGASGIISFTVSYDELSDYINSTLIPENEMGDGAFRLLAENEVENGSTEIIDMLKTENGERMYAVAVGKVNAVKISEVVYAGSFFDDTWHWYCSEMDNAALQIETMIPDGMPRLKISWKNINGDNVNLITQSGEDGSLMLVSDQVDAVG